MNFHMVLKYGRKFLSFCQEARVWQTDRQTERLWQYRALHRMQWRGNNGRLFEFNSRCRTLISACNQPARWTRDEQVKLWDPLRTRAIPERLRGAFTTRRYTNPRLPLRTFTLTMHRLNSMCARAVMGRLLYPALQQYLYVYVQSK